MDNNYYAPTPKSVETVEVCDLDSGIGLSQFRTVPSYSYSLSMLLFSPIRGHLVSSH